MRQFFSLYSIKYPEVLVYMLQNTEYNSLAYLRWFWRTDDFSRVMYRRRLDKTRSASLLLYYLIVGIVIQVSLGFILIVANFNEASSWAFLGWALLVSYPIVWAYLLVVPLIIGRWVIVEPQNNRAIAQSKEIFAKHKAIKIAIVGSYGKTSMKELLGTVLKEGKNVAITPANKNVSVSHSRFAQKLSGTEEVLVIEYGEGKPGDISRFAEITKPNMAIITGLAPAHLDQYPSLESAGEDIFSIVKVVGASNTYVNIDSVATKQFIQPTCHKYSHKGVMGWKISGIKIGFEGLSFVMTKGKQTLKIKSGLLGRHQVGPLALVSALGIELGLTKKQVETGVAKTKAFEHRMEPRSVRGAWILDDTYNGNIDGVVAGLALLSELPAKRKIYVTPGLVDQGIETKKVHLQIGKEVAKSNPDVVVLMENSTTPFIKMGLENAGYRGELRVENDPLEFYLNIEHFIASGDVILLQNDWPDNYN